MALAGLTDPLVGLIAGSILLISTVVAATCSRTARPLAPWHQTATIQFR